MNNMNFQIDWDKWMKDHHVKLKGEEKNDRIQKAVQKKERSKRFVQS